MVDDREKISTGPNEEAANAPIAASAPGLPDDALSPGQIELPPAPSDEEVARIARKLGAPISA